MRVKHTITIWEDEEAESDITEDIEAYVMSQWPRDSTKAVYSSSCMERRTAHANV